MGNSFFDLAINRILGRSREEFEYADVGARGDYVILIHGLNHTSKSMNKIAKALDDLRYSVLKFDYPSRKHSIDILSDCFLHEYIREHCVDKNKKIHFVTHSMGGIVLRRYLRDNTLNNLGRTVMIAPPNHGSEIATTLKDWYIFKFFGPAGQQLCTGKKSYLNLLPKKVNFDVGVISGNKSINPLSYFLIKKENDGIVSVSSTKVMGMQDHVILDASHFFILFNEETISNIVSFLSCGCLHR